MAGHSLIHRCFIYFLVLSTTTATNPDIFSIKSKPVLLLPRENDPSPVLDISNLVACDTFQTKFASREALTRLRARSRAAGEGFASPIWCIDADYHTLDPYEVAFSARKWEESGCPRTSQMSSSRINILEHGRNTSASTKIFSVALIFKERRGSGPARPLQRSSQIRRSVWQFSEYDGEENLPDLA
ncbi:hypothetical protein PIB30_050344 [Stylosanthes scabra]|uniref:Uncharacterized protein n=1 Tax=Stylosanthes scabra TaxID=79078 RepID=A0ABU6WFZ3_9FABA|nr:hypothetical protein [Stylosanthes scabra]